MNFAARTLARAFHTSRVARAGGGGKILKHYPEHDVAKMGFSILKPYPLIIATLRAILFWPTSVETYACRNLISDDRIFNQRASIGKTLT